MSTTLIPWVRNPDGSRGEVWNVWSGCEPVGEECFSCWARTVAENSRYASGFPDGFALTLRPHRVEDPLHWRKPRGVFTHSTTDPFLSGVPRSLLVSQFAVMAATGRHTYMMLTKRAGVMRSVLSSAEFVAAVRQEATSSYGLNAAEWRWPLPNLRLGISAGTQGGAVARLRALAETPAAFRWASIEPLIGPVALTRIDALDRSQPQAVYDALGRRYGVPGRWQAHSVRGLDWVVVGGESGRVHLDDPFHPPQPEGNRSSRVRPMQIEWIRKVVQECVAAGVPVFAKQLGSVQAHVLRLSDHKGEDLAEWPDTLADLKIRQFPGFGHH